MAIARNASTTTSFPLDNSTPQKATAFIVVPSSKADFVNTAI